MALTHRENGTHDLPCGELSILSNELILNCLNQLSPDELLRLRLTCTYFLETINLLIFADNRTSFFSPALDLTHRFIDAYRLQLRRQLLDLFAQDRMLEDPVLDNALKGLLKIEDVLEKHQAPLPALERLTRSVINPDYHDVFTPFNAELYMGAKYLLSMAFMPIEYFTTKAVKNGVESCWDDPLSLCPIDLNIWEVLPLLLIALGTLVIPGCIANYFIRPFPNFVRMSLQEPGEVPVQMHSQETQAWLEELTDQTPVQLSGDVQTMPMEELIKQVTLQIITMLDGAACSSEHPTAGRRQIEMTLDCYQNVMNTLTQLTINPEDSEFKLTLNGRAKILECLSKTVILNEQSESEYESENESLYESANESFSESENEEIHEEQDVIREGWVRNPYSRG